MNSFVFNDSQEFYGAQRGMKIILTSCCGHKSRSLQHSQSIKKNLYNSVSLVYLVNLLENYLARVIEATICYSFDFARHLCFKKDYSRVKGAEADGHKILFVVTLISVSCYQ